MPLKTFSFRIKDVTSGKALEAFARSVNFVWNFCNESQHNAVRHRKRWLTGFDLNYLTAGCAKDLGLHSQTIQAIGEQYAVSRRQYRKRWLRWRSRKALGWIPFKAGGIKLKGDSVVYLGKTFRFWKSREVPSVIKCGNFSQDSRGRWYVNLVCEYEEPFTSKVGSVGIDLGLKTTATASSGKKFDAQKFFSKYERKLAHHQRCNNRRQVRTVHAKVANSRKNFNHQVSHELTRDFNVVIVGDVSSTKLLQTKMAKSVSDAAWGQLRSFLEYKAIARGGMFLVVSEYNTTRTCSACGSIVGPSGKTGLRVREWACSGCSTVHDRDINAAVNIERAGLAVLHKPVSTQGIECC